MFALICTYDSDTLSNQFQANVKTLYCMKWNYKISSANKVKSLISYSGMFLKHLYGSFSRFLLCAHDETFNTKLTEVLHKNKTKHKLRRPNFM